MAFRDWLTPKIVVLPEGATAGLLDLTFIIGSFFKNFPIPLKTAGRQVYRLFEQSRESFFR